MNEHRLEDPPSRAANKEDLLPPPLERPASYPHL
jgi:hypothetical protein